jgi:TonB-linked SusC/RagA family outer membrane protein
MRNFIPKKSFLSRISKAAMGQMVILLLMISITYAKNSYKSAALDGSKHLNLTTTAIINIKGQVTDKATGQPLIGVSVKVKNTTNGVATDVNGKYTINNVPDNATLVVSYIGYITSEVNVSGKTVVDIQLEANAQNLNEVVVMGYNTQKKTSVTGAVSTLAVKDVAQKPVVNITNDLVGRVSGVIATQGSGEPGQDGSALTIRGAATTGRTGALTVVDGVPRDFSRLDPNSIETVTILKDAAAVAPYGVAGANGVILITTKQGKMGKPTLSYSGYYGFQSPTSVPRFVNSYQYATLRNEATVNDGVPGSPTIVLPYSANDLALFQNHQDPDGHADGHPLDDIIKQNRPIQYHNLSLSGGTEDLKYFASVGYNHQAGMWDPTYLDKFNGSLALTANATKTTTVSLKVNAYQENQHYPAIGAGSIINQAERQNPTYPVQYTNGLAAGYIGQSLYSEIYQSGYQINNNKALLTQLSIDQKLPIEGLSIKGVLSYDNGPDPLGFSGNQSFFTKKWATPQPFTNPQLPVGNTTGYGPGVVYNFPIGYGGPTKPNYEEDYGDNTMITYQGSLNYASTFGKSNVTGVLVAEYRNVTWQNFQAKRLNYNLSIDQLSFGGALPTDVTVGGTAGGQKQLGYIYKLGYSYDSKYLFEASGRYDGSYVFAPGHRFGFFPAFSAGWRISEEKFMKDIRWIDNLKIRGSYGVSGNYPPGGQYQYLSAFQVNSNSAVIGGSATQSISENLQGNPGITWETADKTDVGVEGSFWNGALGIEADYFYEKRSNFLVGIGGILPPEYGVAVGNVNGGVITNHGIELTLTTHKAFANGLRLDIKGTFTFANNKLLEFPESASTYNNPNTRRTGRSINEIFGLQGAGYYTPDDFVDPSLQFPVLKPGIPIPNYGKVRPGDIKYADINGPTNDGNPDGKVDANDITDIGHPQTPKIIYGIAPRLTYKNFDLDLLVQGSALSNIVLSDFYAYPFVSSGSASELVYNDHWTPSTPDALYPRISGTPIANNTQTSSWFVRNDSYIRLKSAELGYTFSKKLLGHSIQSLRIYAAGQNLLFFTPYMKESIDPENSGNNQTYYQQRVITFGVNATF